MRARDGLRATRSAPRIKPIYAPSANLHTYQWQVDKELYERLVRAAHADERSTAAYLRVVVKRHLDDLDARDHGGVIG